MIEQKVFMIFFYITVVKTFKLSLCARVFYMLYLIYFLTIIYEVVIIFIVHFRSEVLDPRSYG